MDQVFGPQVFGCDHSVGVGATCLNGTCVAPAGATPLSPVEAGAPLPAGNLTVPSGWMCDPHWFGVLDGCDCNCGVQDPDCDVDQRGSHNLPLEMIVGGIDPNNYAINCIDPTVATCSNGVCSTGAATSTTNFTAPEGWTGPAEYYGSGDGCDCGYGLGDPDCLHEGHPATIPLPPAMALHNCEQSSMTDALFAAIGLGGTQASMTCVMGECVPLPANVGPVPADWTCEASFYGTGDGCDCECGAVDPDCHEDMVDTEVIRRWEHPGVPPLNCRRGETCVSGKCRDFMDRYSDLL